MPSSVDLLRDELADVLVRVLRLRRRRDLPRADGPDGLVGDDDLAPVADHREHRGKLTLANLRGARRLEPVHGLDRGVQRHDVGPLTSLVLEGASGKGPGGICEGNHPRAQCTNPGRVSEPEK